MASEFVFKNSRYIKAKAEFVKGETIYDAAPLFRKRFFIDKHFNNAKVYLHAPGYAKFYINGKPITEDLFISPVSNYEHLLWYQIYDVSSLIKTGENVLGVICGNGWYNVDMKKGWNYYNAPWRDNPKFILSLEIDGKEQIVSDKTWLCNNSSFITYNQIWSGENVDFRDYNEKWNTLEFDDSKWQYAVEDDKPLKGEFKFCDVEPIREMENLSPNSVTENNGKHIFDFGKNITGYIKIKTSRKSGNQLVIRYAEEVDKNGEMAYNNLDRYCVPYEFQTDKIIEGEKSVIYSPYFTYHGFRYIQIEGIGERLNEYDVKAVSICQTVERNTDFECGDELLNYIYRAGINSTKYNMHYSLIDCPTREKLGWLNDAMASCEQTFINFNVKKLYEKWIVDIFKAVREDGALPGIVPTSGWGYSFGAVCDGALFEIPYRYYEYTGSAKLLIEGIPYFYKNLQFLAQKDFGDTKVNFLGDWFGNGYTNPKVPEKFIEKCYEIKNLRILALAENLNENYKAEKNVIKKRKQKIKEFLEEYFYDDGKCKVLAQTAFAFCLAEEIYKDKSILIGQLVSKVEEDGFNSTCGMVGTQYIYNVLTDIGKPEYAYKLLTNSQPGYKTWQESGATTLWETWLVKNDGSHNHHMYSCVLSWLIKTLLGITPKANVEQITINPQIISDVKYCKGHVQTIYGKVEIFWKIQNGNVELDISVPIDGKFIYKDQVLKAGKHLFNVKI